MLLQIGTTFLLALRAIASKTSTTASARCVSDTVQIHCSLMWGGDAPPESIDAFGKFEDYISTTGWARLHILGFLRESSTDPLGKGEHSTQDDPEIRMAFAAGYVEGALTWEQTYLHQMSYYAKSFENASNPRGEKWGSAVAFIEANDIYVRSRIDAMSAVDPFWREVALVYAQLDGLIAGHRSVCTEGKCLERRDFLLLNAEEDLSNIIDEPFSSMDKWTYETAHEHMRKTTHCSAIVKVLPDNSDLVMGHNTWTGYYTMLRTLKEYNLPFSSSRSSIVLFSSYFGALYSGDDFYVLNSGLMVQETTNAVYNASTTALISPRSVLTWARTIVANHQAYDGPSWARWFSPENSGTINNQWMIVSLHLFKAGSKLPDGTLIVLEQMPGKIVWADMSKTLRERGWWASYNEPYFPAIRDISGSTYMEHKFGPAYSYALDPRGKIFHRDAPHANNISAVKHLLRYNDWQHDPFSAAGYGGPDESRSAENSIAARYDLMLNASTREASGNTDAKLCSVSECLNLQFQAVSGPTNEQQPSFSWTGEWASSPHFGQPTVFNFDWVSFSSTTKVVETDSHSDASSRDILV